MTQPLRALRRRILTPGTSAARLDVRGFHHKDDSARDLLENIGLTFLAGYAHAAYARTPAEAQARLDEIPRPVRGFAYEGATMAFAVRDALPVRRGDLTARFIAGPAGAHTYMAYVGIGWAMARLPRFCWSRLDAPDPLLRWLVLDGYGFHQAYFHTRRYVRDQYQDDRFRWPPQGPRWYASRAIDQGIGRALWFVGGADPAVVAGIVEGFAAPRRGDLYAGAGLAATYAGGASDTELGAFWRRAGEYRPQVAQGSAFAAAARVRAGLVVTHNELATALLCGMTPEEAARVCEQTRPAGPADAIQPAYEVWRRRTAEQLVSIGRS